MTWFHRMYDGIVAADLPPPVVDRSQSHDTGLQLGDALLSEDPRVGRRSGSPRSRPAGRTSRNRTATGRRSPAWSGTAREGPRRCSSARGPDGRARSGRGTCTGRTGVGGGHRHRRRTTAHRPSAAAISARSPERHRVVPRPDSTEARIWPWDHRNNGRGPLGLAPPSSRIGRDGHRPGRVARAVVAGGGAGRPTHRLISFRVARGRSSAGRALDWQSRGSWVRVPSPPPVTAGSSVAVRSRTVLLLALVNGGPLVNACDRKKRLRPGAD